MNLTNIDYKNIVIDGEIWKPIEGFAGYEVSNEGRVRSKKRNQEGSVLSFAFLSKNARPHILLCNNGIPMLRIISRLVYETFVSRIKSGNVICHNNNDPCDNNVNNLRQDTPKGNMADRVIFGTDARGEKSYKSKLSNIDAFNIRMMKFMRFKVCEISRMYDVSNNTIYSILAGITYIDAGGPVKTTKKELDTSTIVMFRKSGHTLQETASKFGCDQSYVSLLCNGKRGIK